MTSHANCDTRSGHGIDGAPALCLARRRRGGVPKAVARCQLTEHGRQTSLGGGKRKTPSKQAVIALAILTTASTALATDIIHAHATAPAGGNCLPPADRLDLDGDGDTTEPVPMVLDGHARVLYSLVDMGAYESGKGNNDCDRDVDPGDFADWAACMTGPGNGAYDPTCETFDVGFDGDANLRDFAASQRELGRAALCDRLHGLVFGPSLDAQDPNQGDAASAEQIRTQMEIVAPLTQLVRTFGCADCPEVSGAIGRELLPLVALGAWLDSDYVPGGAAAKQQHADNLMAAALAGDADMAVVGSGVLLRRDLDEAALLGYINQLEQRIRRWVQRSACPPERAERRGSGIRQLLRVLGGRVGRRSACVDSLLARPHTLEDIWVQLTCLSTM